MANRDTPFGAKPVMHVDGSAWNGQTEVFEVLVGDATAMFIGDLVKAADAPTGVYPACAAATAGTGNLIIGVCVGFVPEAAYINQIHRTASTKRHAYIVTDPSVIYEMQEDSDATNLAYANIGSNVAFIAGAGSTTTGISGHEIDSSNIATQDTTPASENLRVVGFVNRSDNALGTNAKWLVKINEHQYADKSVGM